MLPGFNLAGGAGGLGLDGGSSGAITSTFGNGAGIAGDFYFQRKPRAIDQLPLYGFLAITVLAGTFFLMKRG